MSALTLALMAAKPYTDPLSAIAALHMPLRMHVDGRLRDLSARCRECRQSWPCRSHVEAHRPLIVGLPLEHRYCCAKEAS